MARIRIIDEWLRSPVSGPSRHRSVMVVAESWSEQRVLMRAFAASADQTRPTIVLYGIELAIGPAGLEAHGEWGIHVEPPADGRAQDLRGELELAARRLAGTKGNPPRLADEAPRFETKATHLWAPGTPPDLPAPPPRLGTGYYEPADVVASASRPRLVASNTHPPIGPADRTMMVADGRGSSLGPSMGGSASMATVPDGPLFGGAAAAAAGFAPPIAPAMPPPMGPMAPMPMTGAGPVGSRTQPGFHPAGAGDGRGATVPRAPAGASTQLSFGSLVGRTMPLGLQLNQAEREVLDALARAPAVGAEEIARIAGTGEPVAWMERFVAKLAELGLDIIHAGVARTGEPTYILRR